MTDLAYQDGHAAYAAGAPKDHNPHNPDNASESHRRWLIGWNDAKREALRPVRPRRVFRPIIW